MFSLQWPLFLLLGLLSGGVSLCFLWTLKFAERLCTTHMGGVRAGLPVIGGAAMGLLALYVPEITYQGFENFNQVLRGGGIYTAEALLAIGGAKILATCVCRASGLVGGIYGECQVQI